MPNLAVPVDIQQRAAKIRLACFDVDGTLTDGRLWFDADGRESKAFSVLDGQGNIEFAMNSSGMYRGWVTSTTPAATAIYSNEKDPTR